MKLTVRLQPKQSQLLELWNDAKTTRIGFGGARGGAKSGGGRRCMILRRLQFPNTTGLILRRTYPELYRSHIIKIFEEFPIMRAWWNEQRKEFRFPNGSRLFMGSAESEKDMAQFYSSEYADILPDECQEFSQYELERLTGSNRCTSNQDIVPKMVYTFMPGLSEAGLPPKGLPYLKRVFIDGDFREEERKHKWQFIQAFAWDNVQWSAKKLDLENNPERESEYYRWDFETRRTYFIENTEFGKTLSSLTDPQLRDAWLNGKWNVFEGQYFKNWAYDKDTLPDEEFRLERWYKVWISGDWGDIHPAAFYFHAQDEHGNVTTFKEWWSIGAGEQKIGETLTQMCAEIRQSRDDLNQLRISDFFLSWDAFGKLNKETRKSIVDMINNALGEGVPRATPADSSPGSRISGARLMHQLIDAGQWKITRSCKKLIECLPTLVRDMQKNPEDVLKVDHSDTQIGDDAYDGCRYGLQNQISTARKPYEERVADRMAQAAQKEPDVSATELVMYRMRVEAEEKKSTHKAIPMKRRSWMFRHNS